MAKTGCPSVGSPHSAISPTKSGLHLAPAKGVHPILATFTPRSTTRYQWSIPLKWPGSSVSSPHAHAPAVKRIARERRGVFSAHAPRTHIRAAEYWGLHARAFYRIYFVRDLFAHPSSTAQTHTHIHTQSSRKTNETHTTTGELEREGRGGKKKVILHLKEQQGMVDACASSEAETAAELSPPRERENKTER